MEKSATFQSTPRLFTVIAAVVVLLTFNWIDEVPNRGVAVIRYSLYSSKGTNETSMVDSVNAVTTGASIWPKRICIAWWMSRDMPTQVEWSNEVGHGPLYRGLEYALFHLEWHSVYIWFDSVVFDCHGHLHQFIAYYVESSHWRAKFIVHRCRSYNTWLKIHSIVALVMMLAWSIVLRFQILIYLIF